MLGSHRQICGRDSQVQAKEGEAKQGSERVCYFLMSSRVLVAYSTVLYCTVVYCTALHAHLEECIQLYRTVLYSTRLIVLFRGSAGLSPLSFSFPFSVARNSLGLGALCALLHLYCAVLYSTAHSTWPNPEAARADVSYRPIHLWSRRSSSSSTGIHLPG